MRSLAIILVQFDRQKYPDALRLLIEKSQAFENTKTTIIVVDNLLPGDWYHEIAPNLFHLGGDNTSWEFSAFDRGCRFLAEQQLHFDLVAFVTDAFTAYGSDFLDLIASRTLDFTGSLQACSGWVDSIFQPFRAFDYEYVQYLRTSFLITTPSVLHRLGPLTTPIDDAVLFTSDPSAPFRPEAPLSKNLQDFLLTWLTGAKTSVSLERVWHSRFDLTPETLPRFEAKCLAILREHLLSARLLSLGIPCYDFRLLSKLSERDVTPDQITIESRKRWQWLYWRNSPIDVEPRFFIETCQIPEVITHGDDAEAKVRGWVVTEPQVPEVFIELSPDRRYAVSCEAPRPDGLPGFDIDIDLQHVPPGSFEISWIIPTQKSRRHRLGSLRVAPCRRFRLQRIFLPEQSIDGLVPMALEGEFFSTQELQEVRPRWNGEFLNLQVLVTAKPRLSSGLHHYAIHVNDSFRLAKGQEHHVFSLHFKTRDGIRHTWSRNCVLRYGDGLAHSLVARHIGPYNPITGLTPVRLQGSVFATSRRQRLQLVHEGRVVLDEKMTWLDSPHGNREQGTLTRETLTPETQTPETQTPETQAPEDPGFVLGRYDCTRSVANIPAGTWDFELRLKPGNDEAAAFSLLDRWRQTVAFLEPVIHVDQVSLEPLPGVDLEHRLLLVGWVENDFLVDYVMLEVDGAQAGSFGLNQLRPDAAKANHEALVRRQGFYLEMAIKLAPGTHQLRLVTGQKEASRSVWTHTMQALSPVSDHFVLDSPDIETLMQRGPSRYWSALQLAGVAETDLRNIVAKLYVDDSKVDEQAILGGQPFLLRHVPEVSGRALVRVVFMSGHTTLFDTETVDVEMQALAVPKEISRILPQFFDHFGIRDPLLNDDLESTCRRLMERNLEDLPAFLERLQQLEQTLRRTRRQKDETFVDIATDLAPALPNRPLRILFACWEVPSLRHGGGVCMSNLLRGLAEKHEVTVLHPFSVEESGWIDDLRPVVSKVISVPREHRPVTYRHDRGIPEHYFANYVPSLRQALEAELAGGDYDVVNYEYTTMFTHLSDAPTPNTLIVHELGIGAKLTTYFKDNTTPDESLEQLQDFLQTVYFYSHSLPEACPHLIALTTEDAKDLAALQPPGTKVYVNTIGVDEDRFLRPEDMLRDDAPTLVFLGNYRHPPNVHAAKFFGEEVMPEIVRRHPQARYVIIGSHVPEELQRLTEHPNIEATGFVDDFRPYLWRATAFVAPIFVGAGMRVKILEAMACSCPIISTQLGMNGLGATPEEHFLSAESASAFVDATCRLIEKPALASQLGDAARRLIEAKHGRREKVAEREAVWAHLLADATPQALDGEAPKTSTSQSKKASQPTSTSQSKAAKKKPSLMRKRA